MSDSITDQLRGLCASLEPDEPVDAAQPSQAAQAKTNSAFLDALAREWTRYHPRTRTRTAAPAVRSVARP